LTRLSGEQRKRSTTATLVKAATAAAISTTPPVNTSERQCAATSIDWPSAPRDDPRDRSSSRGGWMKFALCYDV
jgi:hypothetical protein